jgi:hypothetical protein
MEIDERVARIEKVVSEIGERNEKVSWDKAWETSSARRALIAALTFVFTSAVFVSIGVNEPLLNALIPVTGYVVSTFSVPWVKRRWVERQREPK